LLCCNSDCGRKDSDGVERTREGMESASQRSAARNAEAARSRQQSATRPPARAVSQRLPKSKVGWDRKFRTVMVVVLCLVSWIGIKAGLTMYSAQQQASAEAGTLRSLKLENRQLRAREAALSQNATIVRDARHLGMVMAGERPYVVIGSSSH
jgi:cell division protein FtsB